MAISLPIVSKFDDKGVKSAEDALKSVAVAGAAAFAAVGVAVVAFGVQAAKAAAEAEAITRGLENAARNAGVFGDSAAAIGRATEALDAHSRKLGELTGIDDEIINQIKTGWLAVPDLAALGTEGINRLAQVTADIAAGTGKDVQTIGLAFQRIAGDTETAFSKLTRAGIVFTDEQKNTFEAIRTTSGEMAAQQYLVDQLAAKYEGAAAAAANPFDRLSVIFQNLKEDIGVALLPAIEAVIPVFQGFIQNLTADPAFEEFLKTLAASFMDLMKAVTPLMAPLTNILMSLMPALSSIFAAVVPVIARLVEAFMPLIEAILPPLMSIIEALLPPLLQIIEAAFMPLVDIVVMLIEAFKPLIEAVLPVIAELFGAIAPIITMLIEAFMPLLQAILDPLVELLGVLIPIVADVLDAFMPFIETLLPPLLDIFMLLIDSALMPLLKVILPPLTTVVKELGNMFKWLKTYVLDPLLTVITSVVDGFKKLFEFNGKTVNITSRVSQAAGVSQINAGRFPGTAKGGITVETGLQWVGEKGPELLSMPRGATVTPLPQHMRADELIGAGRGGGNQAVYNISVTAGMGANGAQLGEEIVNAIRKYERTSGAVFARA